MSSRCAAVTISAETSGMEQTLESLMAAASADAQTTMACNMMEEATLEGVLAFIEKREPRSVG